MRKNVAIDDLSSPLEAILSANCGYRRYSGTTGIDSGYKAFGITRSDALDVLLENLNQNNIQSLLAPLVDAAFLINRFCQFTHTKTNC